MEDRSWPCRCRLQKPRQAQALPRTYHAPSFLNAQQIRFKESLKQQFPNGTVDLPTSVPSHHGTASDKALRSPPSKVWLGTLSDLENRPSTLSMLVDKKEFNEWRYARGAYPCYSYR